MSFSPKRIFAFTLVEMLVGLAVLMLILVLLLTVVNQTTQGVRRTSAQVDAF
ncbi:MAG: prepilin-type N-terminal cleavage/methylation domain-containing protein, partial [Chthoniobacterales bacterium]